MNLCSDLVIKSAETIAVGTEILMGQIVNSNAAFIASELQKIGISQYYQTVVGDNPGRLKETIERAMGRSEAVIITGGLGPTRDDLTMEVAASAVGQKLITNEAAVAEIKSYFTSRGRRMAESNLKQALLPEFATSIPNHNGTAPGAFIPYYKDGKCSCLLILLPGPPNENQPMFRDSVAPLLREHGSVVLDNTFIHMIDIGESDAAEVLADLLADSQVNPSLAPYASTGEVTFRLTLRRENNESGALAQEMLDEIQARLGKYIYHIGNKSLTEVTADLLFEQEQSVAFVESLTAGMACAELAKVPGISQVLRGGICTYQTETKHSVLGVSEELLAQYGAVSPECAAEMARLGRTLFASDYCVSTTGVAGPGTVEGKTAGLFYIGVATPQAVFTREFHYRGNRQKNRDTAVKQALNQLRKALLGQLTQTETENISA